MPETPNSEILNDFLPDPMLFLTIHMAPSTLRPFGLYIDKT